MKYQTEIAQAAKWIREAEVFVVAAGAGMGVDSGLPDFRGNEGFWKAYPPMREAGLSFIDMANGYSFLDNPSRAWGFYGHRLNLYRNTEPHEGFHAILRMIGKRPSFVYTSNVDGAFQKAGFQRIYEIHGSIHWLQCSSPKCYSVMHGAHMDGLWRADDHHVKVDPKTFLATDQLPLCPKCGAVARPNILMFGDPAWIHVRADHQRQGYHQWRFATKGKKTVVLEMGAGTAIPSVRAQSNGLCAQGAKLVRINPREFYLPVEGESVAIPMGAKDALLAIEEALS